MGQPYYESGTNPKKLTGLRRIFQPWDDPPEPIFLVKSRDFRPIKMENPHGKSHGLSLKSSEYPMDFP